MEMMWLGTIFPKVFFLYLLSLSLTKGYSSSCESGWYKHQNYCYRFFVESRTWIAARASCALKSADLLSISSQSEQTFLDNNSVVLDSSWMGMYDNKTGSKWKWIDGSTTSYENWNTDKYRNRASDAKCAVLEDDGKWAPQNCDQKYGFICKVDEKHIVKSGKCNTKNNYCNSFSIWRILRTFKESTRICDILVPSKFASIENADYNNFLVNSRPNSNAYWIGLKDVGTQPRKFSWIDGTESQFENWGNNEPNNANYQNEHCAEIRTDGKWNDNNCDKTLPFVCKKKGDVDECKENTHNCGDRENCVNTYGAYYCDCKVGYVRNGTVCQDIDECKENTHNCSDMENCVNTYGAYYCDCKDGYVRNGTVCQDIDECKENTHNCSDSNRENCVNTYGAYYCDCKVGFVRNGKVCQGHASKTPCESGWYEYGNYCYRYFMETKYWRAARESCVLKGADLLSIGSQSEQTFIDNNSVIVRPSWIGMTDDSTGSSWKWVDGSSTGYSSWNGNKYRNRSSDAKCAVLGIDGSWIPQNCDQKYEFICQYQEYQLKTCDSGWMKSDDHCYLFVPKLYTFQEATRFCKAFPRYTKFTSILNWRKNRFLITSRPNSTAYWIGLKDVGTKPRKFRWVDGTENKFQNWGNNEPNNANYQNEHCVQINTNGEWNDIYCREKLPFVCKKKGDVDECETSTHSCGIRQKCINTRGSYYCVCKDGYVRNGQSCQDINECSNSGSNNCSSLARCVNNDGSHECICNSGYSGNGITCSDIDECSDKSHSCHPFAKCSNTVGYFSCKCNTGYSGDGRSCLDIDECAATHSCHSDAKCLNNQGSYTCQCKTGYSGDGKNCVDINECQSDLKSCHQNATCVNSNGSYTCTCKTGFTGDGKVTCKNKDDCALHPCLNSGVCVDGINSYTCSCKDGYDGQHCENEKDECASNPCQNNGQCYDFVNQFRCICNAGYIGTTCENECPDGTYGYDCLGTCNCDNANTNSLTCNKVTGACSCKPGYYGNMCNKACDNGRYGPKCSLTCLCKNGSVCYHVTGQCTCATGYTGQYCDTAITNTEAPEPTEQPEPASK